MCCSLDALVTHRVDCYGSEFGNNKFLSAAYLKIRLDNVSVIMKNLNIGLC